MAVLDNMEFPPFLCCPFNQRLLDLYAVFHSLISGFCFDCQITSCHLQIHPAHSLFQIISRDIEQQSASLGTVQLIFGLSESKAHIPTFLPASVATADINIADKATKKIFSCRS